MNNDSRTMLFGRRSDPGRREGEQPSFGHRLARKVVLRQTCILGGGEPAWKAADSAALSPGAATAIARGWEAKMGRRVTFRLPNATYDLLQKRCGGMGCDASFIVRSALKAFLGDDAAVVQGDHQGGAAIPPEVFSRVGPYLAPVRDVRLQVRDLFIELLAAAWAAQKLFPRSPGTREAFAALAALSRYFKVGSGVGRI